MNIKDNSQLVKENDIFIAIDKGHDYINDAISRGAKTVIAQKGLYEVETIIVNDTHKYLVDYLYKNYYNKIKDLKLIGVTGTNGKTTTCFLIYQALNKLNVKCAYIGTIGFYLEEKVRDLRNTTPDILEMYDILLECALNNVEYVVMETSSHGLDMNRLDGFKFEYGIFTNLTEDHLDYHKTMENYALAKQKLFNNCNKTIINKDDEYSNYFIKNDSILYGINDIESYSFNLNQTTFKMGEQYKINLIGKHNLYNILAVINLLKSLNLDISVTNYLLPPPGRTEMIKNDSNLIIIDYAHTPDAVEKIIDSVKELEHNKIITIVGCGGNRDKFKRPIMGKIATDKSDYVIFTNDNPREEDENSIMNDIIHSLDKQNYEIILNRKNAIIKGIQTLTKNDILLVLGKGHEKYQVIGKTKYEFDDKKIILENI